MTFREKMRAVMTPLVAEWVFIIVFVFFNNAVEFPFLIRSRSLGTALTHELLACCESAFLAALVVWLYTRPGMRWLKWVVTAVMAAGFFVSLFLYLQFDCPLLASIITLFLETNREEATGFVGDFIAERSMIISAVVTLVAIAILLIADRRCRASTSPSRVMMVIIAVVVVLGATLFPLWVTGLLPAADADRTVNKETSITSNVDFISRVTVETLTLRQVAKEADDISRVTATYDETPTVTTADSINIVLVIGESYNKYHASLYGYALETTPRMTAEQTAGRLVRFDDAVSAYNVTSQSLKNMLSLNSIAAGERWCDFPFVTTVFKRAGFDVLMWDAQNTLLNGGIESDFDITLNTVIYSDVMKRASYTLTNDMLFKYDGDLVDDFFARNGERMSGGHTFAVLHLNGQHIAYARKYPDTDEYKVFTAADVTLQGAYMNDEKRHTVAEYDNATRYNDYVLGRLFDRLADTRSIVIYLADHGEEVYDYRDFKMRDRTPDKTLEMVKYENDIPMIIWFAPALAEQMTHLPADAARRPFIAYDLPHLLLGLAGIQSKYYRPERDLLSPLYRPQRRVIYDTLDYDRLMSGYRK